MLTYADARGKELYEIMLFRRASGLDEAEANKMYTAGGLSSPIEVLILRALLVQTYKH
jgi:hypothetical protein